MNFKQGILFSLLLLVNNILATHNRGGEITYVHISGLTYEFTITTCTDVGSSTQTDRDELYLDFDLGTPYAQTDTLQRISDTPMPFDHKKNIYRGIHTFTSAGTHRITMEDPNRNAGILNVYPSGGNSDDIVFALETYLIIDPTQGIAGANNSVQFDDCPCPEIACVNKPYCYNPLAYDIDDDSLSYELVAPLGVQAVPLSIPAIYMFPDDIGGGNMTIDPIYGTVCWNNPMVQGEFNFTIKVSEWRNGNLVGSVIRDIQLTVQSNCLNDPPEIDPIPDTCIVAGATLNLNITGLDVNNDDLEMVASGLPLSVNSSPAQFSYVTNLGGVNGTFLWQTNCSHIKAGVYSVMIALTDDGDPVFSDYESFSIRVIPPVVTGLSANAFGNGVNLSWDPSSCTNADGYKIYRTLNPNFTLPDCCTPFDLEDYGFTYVDQVIGANTTFYYDNTSLTLGIDYCYVVTAIYSFGQVESCPSDTSCARLIKEVPVITHVSVINTNLTSGSDTIMWSKPTELDTLQYPGPYHYKVYHGISQGSDTLLIGTTNSSMFLENTDTVFIHNNVDTETQANYYRVELYYTNNAADSLVGATNTAGSIFLNTIPNDNEIKLLWNEQVPWINDNYEVFRANSINGIYFSIATVNTQEFLDTGLVNGVEYCYYIKSSGHYTSPSIIDPILNKSQKVCATPVDLTPPCPPSIFIQGDCIEGENLISWTNPNNSCADDVMSYSIYFGPTDTSALELIATVNDNTDTSFIHSYNWNGLNSVAGCYAVTATDSAQYGNESILSDTVCVDNCPEYWLPNVFSPNGDGENDSFMAIEPFNYIESINIQIFNRWGQLVFESKDPYFRWDGNSLVNNEAVPSGVYYYYCIANSIRLSGIVPVSIQGFLHLFRDYNSFE